MKYLQIDIKLNRLGIELLTSELIEMGITDFMIVDPQDIEELMENKNSYDWDYVDDEIIKNASQEPKLTLYFNHDNTNDLKINEITNLINKLKSKAKKGEFGKGINLGSLAIDYSVINDDDWKNKWKEYFKPTRISKQIVVKPTWESYTPGRNEKIIEIDPGMAFGTGTHETTSLCIKMLEKYMTKNDKVLDVGTGSGILSIAAALLGASNVLAVDIDPVAVDVARENVILNKQNPIIEVQYGDLTKGIDFKANVVVANLMADLVMMLAKDVKKHLLLGGIFISSGILLEKEKEVKEAIEKAGFEVIEVSKDDIWVAIVAKVK